MSQTVARSAAFCARFGLRLPVMLAPMAGASAPALSIAVINSGGLGACGALLMQPQEIKSWAAEVRARSSGPFNMNLWIPDPPPQRDLKHEQRVREFLSAWGPPVPPEAADSTPPDFAGQCEALLAIRPAVFSSVMGLYAPEFVARCKRSGMSWFANVSTVTEALAAEAAGADVIVAQGMEAGGHRGSFDASLSERQLIGLFALLPAVVDAVRVPVIATGAIADGRAIAAALTLGASAVQIGTGLLRTPEAGIHPAWAEALAHTAPEDTMISTVFSGRAGRSIATEYVLAATARSAPAPAPYPVQRGLTSAMRSAANKSGDLQCMQVWAGQAARLAQAEAAGELIERLWQQARQLLLA
jgi:nitronate monooxygenase